MVVDCVLKWLVLQVLVYVTEIVQDDNNNYYRLCRTLCVHIMLDQRPLLYKSLTQIVASLQPIFSAIEAALK